jgi:hypothetical protein
MTEAELARCFFPSARKELIIETLTLLQTRAGESRIKLGLVMPLGDGKLVGLPGWIGDSLDIIGREDSLESAVKFDVNLKEMTLTIYSTEDSQKPAQLSDVNLHFVAYVAANTELWGWFYKHFRKSIFTKFETTQADLPLAQPDTQMKLGDDHETERKEATSKAHDAEFARAN